MKEHIPETEMFKVQLQAALLRETKHSSTRSIEKHDTLYTRGQATGNVYLIVSGRIKLTTLSYGKKECLLTIHGAGDLFGELCLSGLAQRQETATAMEETLVKEIPCNQFLQRLVKDSLLIGFIKYLTGRMAEQQEVITQFATLNCEQRLGQTLLQLARRLARKDPPSSRLELHISHEELAAMVGTTRPRISILLQRFRNLGLIKSSEDRHLIIKERKLVAYLASIV